MTRWPFGILTACLIAVGCLRPSLPVFLFERWHFVVVVLAVAAAGVQLSRALVWGRLQGGQVSYEGVLLALLPIALAVLYIQPQRIASDGIFYYAPLHSLVIDADLDFENEYRVLGAMPGYFMRTDTGRLPNNFSVGPAILWTPFFLAAHVLGLLGLFRATGFGYPYFTAVATGTALVGFIGVVLLFRLTKTYFRERIAFVATLLLWLASFHVWYMLFEPSMSHALAMCSVTAFVLFTKNGLKGGKDFALAGILGGLVILIRWQNVIFLPVALVVTWMKHGRPKSGELIAGSLCGLLVFAPQLIYWKLIYGSFVLIPQGGNYMRWGEPQIAAVLFSSRHGLLAWSPALWLGVLGLLGVVRRLGVLGWGLFSTALLALYVNACVWDWWAGASFGSRRFDGVLPTLGLGIAVCLDWLVPRVQRHPLATLSLLVSPFLVWNAVLTGLYFGGSIPPDAPTSFQRAAGDGIELIYRWSGYPFSWPASVPQSLRSGWPLSSYDLIGAKRTYQNVDIRMGDTDALFLGGGWTLPRREQTQSWRGVHPMGADVIVTLREPSPYVLSLEGTSDEAGEVWLNASRLGAFRMDDSGKSQLSIPESRIVAGVNVLLFRPAPGTELSLSRIRLHRSDGVP